MNENRFSAVEKAVALPTALLMTGAGVVAYVVAMLVGAAIGL